MDMLGTISKKIDALNRISSKPHINFERNSLAPNRGATYGNDLISLAVVEGFDEAGTAA